MVLAQAIAETGLLSNEAIMEVLTRGLGGRLAGQKVLVLIPDHTPSMTCDAPWHAGMAFAMVYMRSAMKIYELYETR